MSVIKIISRKYYRILIWLIVLCVLAVLTPLFSLELIPVLAFGCAVMTARFLKSIRIAWLQEVVFGLLLVLTLAAQFLI